MHEAKKCFKYLNLCTPADPTTPIIRPAHTARAPVDLLKVPPGVRGEGGGGGGREEDRGSPLLADRHHVPGHEVEAEAEHGGEQEDDQEAPQVPLHVATTPERDNGPLQLISFLLPASALE